MPEEVQIPISWDKDDGLGRLFDSVVLERPVQDGVLDLSRGDVVTHHFVLRGRGRLHEGPFGTCESAPCPVSHVMSD